MRLLHNILLCCLLSGCALFTDRRDTDADTEDVQKGGGQSEVDVSQKSLHLLDAKALTQVYGNFFDAEGEVFSDAQRKNLGSINYGASQFMHLNGVRLLEITQAYVKTLRTVLLDMCVELTNREQAKLANAQADDTFPKNTLLKRNGAPTAEEVSQIMDVMFGYHFDGKKHKGAEEYANLIAKNMQALSPSDEIFQDELVKQYTLLCMAIGQDSRVYLR